MLESLSSVFNAVVFYGVAGTTAAIAIPLLWFKGPRQLKPENQTAKIITARGWPNVFTKGKIVAKDGAEMYLGWGASDIGDIPLGTFSVPVVRKGKGEDPALTLADKVKAELTAEFLVRVDTSSKEKMIRAMETLQGTITKESIAQYCTPKFDDALRTAAAKMSIEELQSEREQFRQTVREALKTLEEDGLVLSDVLLRQLNQSPIGDFEKDNYFDAQGLKKVVQVIEESKKIINDTEQSSKTQIQERNKDEEIKRLAITEQQTKETLSQNERVQQMQAEQAKRVAEIKAENDKMAKLAQLKAEEEMESRRITKEQQVGVAEEQKQQALKVANETRQRAEQEATIARQKQIELAERDKQIALNAKALEEAEAEKAANEKRAEAVEAAEAVTTARLVAEAERNKQVEVIKAQQEAEKTTAAQKIDADSRVYIAEQNAKAAKTEAAGLADALKIESGAEAEAAKLEAQGAYEKEFQRLKAVADGKLADADAIRKLNEAQNALSAEAMRHFADLKRIEITPEVVGKVMALASAIKAFNIVSMDGVSFPGMNGTAAPGGAAPSGNVFDQIIEGLVKVAVTKPTLEKFIETFGGDKGVAAMMPNIGTAADALIPPAANDDAKKPAAPAPVPSGLA